MTTALLLAMAFLDADAADVRALAAFPTESYALEMCALNRAFKQHTEEEARWAPQHEEELYELGCELERRYQVWDALSWARRGDECGQHWRAELKQMLGAGAFYQGQMPPPVPLAALRRID